MLALHLVEDDRRFFVAALVEALFGRIVERAHIARDILRVRALTIFRAAGDEDKRREAEQQDRRATERGNVMARLLAKAMGSAKR